MLVSLMTVTMRTTRKLRIELQYWIVCCLELKDCLIFTANVEFGCWSDFPISNSCSELKNTSIMELVVGEIKCLQMREKTIFDFVDKFKKSFIFDFIV